MSRFKQKSRANRRKSQLQRHKRSVLGVSTVLLLLVVVIAASSISLRSKNEYYKSQEAELESQIAEEEERAAEIEDLEEYVGTDEYVEQTAKDKLGLVYENEIIFRRK